MWGGGDDDSGAPASVNDESPTTGTTATAKPTVTPTATPEPTSEASLTADVVFFGADPDEEFPLARFVAVISNPSDTARDGVEVTWTMFDESNAIVGFKSGTRCPVPANGTLTYVGGAGSVFLFARPSSVEVEVTDDGSSLDEGYTNQVLIESVALEPAPQFDFGFREVSFSLTNTSNEALVADNVDIAIVVKDAQGEIVGAGFHQLENVPDQLQGGSRVAQSASIPADLWTGPATSAEVFACYNQSR